MPKRNAKPDMPPVHTASDEAAVDQGCTFDDGAAQRVRRWFADYLRHSKGRWAGQPFELAGWQYDRVIAPLFGWKRPDGLRRFRTVYVEVPRKNGKSTMAAGIGNFLLVGDGEPGGEIYSAAADRQQANIVHSVARDQVLDSPELSDACRVFHGRHRIVMDATKSFYQVLSADAHTKHGLNAHGVIFDELHAQPNQDLWDVLTTSGGSRAQPVVFAITTAGYDQNSVCWKQHEYAQKILDGVVTDTTFLPVIYGAEESDDWTSPEVWQKANPNLGISLSEEYLQQESNKALEMPSYQNTFRRLHLNQWTRQDIRWMPMDRWDACDGEVNEELLRGRPCYGGLDLSTTTDASAFVLAFPPEGTDGEWQIVRDIWIPGDRIQERSRRDRVPYEVWLREGLIHATPGNVIDYTAIRARVNERANQFNILEIGYDPWNATQIVTQLSEEDGLPLIEIRQGFASMSAPTKGLEMLVSKRQIAHGGDPVLRWMMNNVTVKEDPSGNIKPDKAKSTEKIDGIVALIIALARGMVCAGTGTSVYEERGVLVL